MKTETKEPNDTKNDPPWKLHECEQLPREGVQILFSMDNRKRKSKVWHLIIRRKATEEDLMNNHILDHEGQIIWETHLEITHCPYCGHKLFELTESNLKEFGQFYHSDFSEWRAKYQ